MVVSEFTDVCVGETSALTWRPHLLTALCESAGLHAMTHEPAVTAVGPLRFSPRISDDGVTWDWDRWTSVDVHCYTEGRPTPIATMSIDSGHAPHVSWQELLSRSGDAFELTPRGGADARAGASYRIPFPALKPRIDLTFGYYEERQAGTLALKHIDFDPSSTVSIVLFERVPGVPGYQKISETPLRRGDREFKIPIYLRGLAAVVERMPNGAARFLNGARIKPGEGPQSDPLSLHEIRGIHQLAALPVSAAQQWPWRTEQRLRELIKSGSPALHCDRPPLEESLRTVPTATVRLIILRAAGAPVSLKDLKEFREGTLLSCVRKRWPHIIDSLPHAKSLDEVQWMFAHHSPQLTSIAKWANGHGVTALTAAKAHSAVRTALEDLLTKVRPDTPLAAQLGSALKALSAAVATGRVAAAIEANAALALRAAAESKARTIDPFGDDPEFADAHGEWERSRAEVDEWLRRAAGVLHFCETGRLESVTDQRHLDSVVHGFRELGRPSMLGGALLDGGAVEDEVKALLAGFRWHQSASMTTVRDAIETKVRGRTNAWRRVHTQREAAGPLATEFPRVARYLQARAQERRSHEESEALDAQVVADSLFAEIIGAARSFARTWRPRSSILRREPTLTLVTTPGHATFVSAGEQVTALTHRLGEKSGDRWPEGPDGHTLSDFTKWWRNLCEFDSRLSALEISNDSFDLLVIFAAAEARRVDRPDHGELRGLIDRLRLSDVDASVRAGLSRADLQRYYELLESPTRP
jgi:hypothetical protein